MFLEATFFYLNNGVPVKYNRNVCKSRASEILHVQLSKRYVNTLHEGITNIKLYNRREVFTC